MAEQSVGSPELGEGKFCTTKSVRFGAATCVVRKNSFPTVRKSEALCPAAAGQLWPPQLGISYWRAEQV